MSDITSTLAAPRRQLHIRRGRLTVVAGPDAGRTWLVDRDVLQIGSLEDCDVVLTDTTVSRQHAEIIRTADGVVLRDAGSTNGTFVGNVRVREVFLTPETRFSVGKSELAFTPEDELIEITPSEKNQLDMLVGHAMSMREVFGVIERVAPTDLTCLITGETGTGKELASRAMHNLSRRSKKPFRVFDCGAAPDTLIESELFGHERGSFTGAHAAREGVFEQAHGGTIFLDEIGELPLELQPKLLRVLEQREVRRVGSGRIRSVDVRVVAATNRDLREEVREGRFREDLYYRLAVVELQLPALRNRREDISLLCSYLLDRARHNPGVRSLAPEVYAVFEAYHWPGNVRELNNVIERALPFTDGEMITLDALPASLRGPQLSQGVTPNAPPSVAASPVDSGVQGLPFKDAKDKIIEAFEREYLVELIERYGGNVSRAARAADMDRKSITRLLKKHGIR